MKTGKGWEEGKGGVGWGGSGRCTHQELTYKVKGVFENFYDYGSGVVVVGSSSLN